MKWRINDVRVWEIVEMNESARCVLRSRELMAKSNDGVEKKFTFSVLRAVWFSSSLRKGTENRQIYIYVDGTSCGPVSGMENLINQVDGTFCEK